MIEPSPVRHHMTRRHDPVRLCDEQPADDDDIPTTDIDALRDARAEATLCPVCQQNSHIHDYSLRRAATTVVEAVISSLPEATFLH